MKTGNDILFQQALISKGSTRWKSFATGALAQIILTSMVVALPFLLPNPLHPNLRAYAFVDISPKMVIHWNAPPSNGSKSNHNRARVNRKSRVSLPDIQARFRLAVISGPAVPSPKLVRRVAPPLIFASAVPELPLSVSAIPTLQAPRAQMQTGNFADFDGAAVESGDGGAGPLSADRRAILSMASPVIILFKPRPRYTSDALTNKIQGDVRLTVIFSASGSVKVLSVIQSLGYGLDQSAETAAGQIRFRPARNRKGLPVDTMAIVRATFNLSECGAGCLMASTGE